MCSYFAITSKKAVISIGPLGIESLNQVSLNIAISISCCFIKKETSSIFGTIDMQFDNKNEGTKQSLFVFRIDSPMLLPSASATLVLTRGEGGRLTVLLGLFKSSELGEQKPGNLANLPSDSTVLPEGRVIIPSGKMVICVTALVPRARRNIFLINLSLFILNFLTLFSTRYFKKQ